ncbi:MAG: TRAM domain-containing protein [Patescibacteria group bacterium]|nr:TRAM domain-containing protein [Patescibacteria group bacterium]
MQSTYLYLGIIAITIFLAMIIAGNKISKLKANTFFIGFFAVIFGLIIGSLAYLPLSQLPDIYGVWVPIIFYLAAVSISLWLFLSRQSVITETFENIGKIFSLLMSLRPQLLPSGKSKEGEILVDTSVLIDGRIVDIAKTGFIPGKLLVPRFILAELQNIADSGDGLRRTKGRRGLDVLNELKKSHNLKIIPNPEEIEKNNSPVDEKLIEHAHLLKGSVITNDYNLNKVAKIQGVKVLNINELSQALRPIILPGEEMEVKIVQEGKEKEQGVAYLDDGTMIVVEKGDGLVGKKVKVEIKRVIQTAAGKMFFAILK